MIIITSIKAIDSMYCRGCQCVVTQGSWWTPCDEITDCTLSLQHGKTANQLVVHHWPLISAVNRGNFQRVATFLYCLQQQSQRTPVLPHHVIQPGISFVARLSRPEFDLRSMLDWFPVHALIMSNRAISPIRGASAGAAMRAPSSPCIY